MGRTVVWKFATLTCAILFFALTGCVDQNDKIRTAYSQELSELKARSAHWPRAEYYRQVYNLRQQYFHTDVYEDAFWRKVIVAAERLDKKQLSNSEFDALYSEWAAEMEDRQMRSMPQIMLID